MGRGRGRGCAVPQTPGDFWAVLTEVRGPGAGAGRALCRVRTHLGFRAQRPPGRGGTGTAATASAGEGGEGPREMTRASPQGLESQPGASDRSLLTWMDGRKALLPSPPWESLYLPLEGSGWGLVRHTPPPQVAGKPLRRLELAVGAPPPPLAPCIPPLGPRSSWERPTGRLPGPHVSTGPLHESGDIFSCQTTGLFRRRGPDPTTPPEAQGHQPSCPVSRWTWPWPRLGHAGGQSRRPGTQVSSAGAEAAAQRPSEQLRAQPGHPPEHSSCPGARNPFSLSAKLRLQAGRVGVVVGSQTAGDCVSRRQTPPPVPPLLPSHTWGSGRLREGG